MRPLTDQSPKPMLLVQGKPLMQWHMEALAAAGQHDMLINTAWLGPQIESHFGLNPDLPEVGRVRLKYSHEGKDFGYALETAGGIVRALPTWPLCFGCWRVIFLHLISNSRLNTKQHFRTALNWPIFGWFPIPRTIQQAILACLKRAWHLICQSRLAYSLSAHSPCTKKNFSTPP